jgi:hypothetical protein
MKSHNDAEGGGVCDRGLGYKQSRMMGSDERKYIHGEGKNPRIASLASLPPLSDK